MPQFLQGDHFPYDSVFQYEKESRIKMMYDIFRAFSPLFFVFVPVNIFVTYKITLH